MSVAHFSVRCATDPRTQPIYHNDWEILKSLDIPKAVAIASCLGVKLAKVRLNPYGELPFSLCFTSIIRLNCRETAGPLENGRY